MADQCADIIRLLELLEIADVWHVVRPLPGDIRDKALIQNEANAVNMGHYVPLASTVANGYHTATLAAYRRRCPARAV